MTWFYVGRSYDLLWYTDEEFFDEVLSFTGHRFKSLCIELPFDLLDAGNDLVFVFVIKW